MSSSTETTGIATIEVTSLNQVRVTQRVKSVVGAVAWHVHNNTASNVKVCINNFRPADAAQEGSFQARFLLENDHCTHSVTPDGIGVIHAIFSGKPKQILKYDVAVNGTIATDPELEI